MVSAVKTSKQGGTDENSQGTTSGWVREISGNCVEWGQMVPDNRQWPGQRSPKGNRLPCFHKAGDEVRMEKAFGRRREGV